MSVKKILIADDESGLRLLVAATLGTLGYEIIEAKDGQEAWALIREHRPDLVLLDLNMPHLNGLEVCQQMKSSAELAPIPVVMLTAQRQPTTQEAAAGAGVDVFLTKPFSPLELLDVVEDILSPGGGPARISA